MGKEVAVGAWEGWSEAAPSKCGGQRRSARVVGCGWGRARFRGASLQGCTQGILEGQDLCQVLGVRGSQATSNPSLGEFAVQAATHGVQGDIRGPRSAEQTFTYKVSEAAHSFPRQRRTPCPLVQPPTPLTHQAGWLSPLGPSAEPHDSEEVGTPLCTLLPARSAE